MPMRMSAMRTPLMMVPAKASPWPLFSGSFLALLRPMMLRMRPAMADRMPMPTGTRISEQMNPAMARPLVVEGAGAAVGLA